MTNEELKKKICDIIAPYVSAYGDDERIADALIAAGLRFGENFTATFDLMALEREHELEHRLAEAEHRALVAERALYNACKHFCQFIVPCPNNDCKRIFCNKQKYGCYHEYFLHQAEKELSEEGEE